MLSATNTVTDVKTAINSTFSELGFADDTAFNNAINFAGQQIYLEYMVPNVGADLYAQVQAKNKVNLTEEETYLYWAEVYFISREVYNNISLKRKQNLSGSSRSFSTEGYSQSVTDSLVVGWDKASWSFRSKAVQYFALAGYHINRMKRGGSFYTDEEPQEFKDD